MTPRPEKSLLQIATNVSYEQLFKIHKKAHKFLIEKKLSLFELPKEEFRHYFLKSIHDYAQFVRKYSFWPLRFVFWTVSKRGRVHCKEIETQYKTGFITFTL